MPTQQDDNQITTKPARTPRSKQPAKHITKNKTALRKRAKIVVKALAEGDSVQAAGIKAGYAPTYANAGTRTLLQNPIIKKSFDKILDSCGVTDARIAQKINSLIDAQKVVITKDLGRIEVPDNTTQLNATTLAAKLKGHLVERSVSVTIDATPVDLSKWRNSGKQPIDVTPDESETG